MRYVETCHLFCLDFDENNVIKNIIPSNMAVANQS